MPRQKREYIEESSHDTSESDESNSRDNSEILEIYNDESSDSSDDSESETSTEETINGRPINKKKIVKKEYNDLRDVMIEYIDKKYAHGKVGEFEVIMMVKNGYVNATKLCKQSGKDFFDWNRLKSTKTMLTFLDTLILMFSNRLNIYVIKIINNISINCYIFDT